MRLGSSGLGSDDRPCARWTVVGLGGSEEDVIRGRVDRTFALEAVIWSNPVAGEWGLFWRSILGVRSG